MAEIKQKTEKSTPVRIYENKKERLGRVVRRMAEVQGRYVTEIEVTDEVFNLGLPKIEKKLGL